MNVMTKIVIKRGLNFVLFLNVLIFSAECPAQTSSWQSIYQSNTNISLTPPSPTAASFQRFGITPISYSSGLPEISIPVYEVKAGDLSMPITLSYHYNGLKPREESSWVGLGWNLSAGGAITRMKRGATDGSRYAGKNYDNISLLDSVNNFGNNQGYYPYKDFLFTTFFSQTYDTEPDIFVFNFMGHQGKFLFIRGYPYFIEYKKWKVLKLGDSGFQITDENGTQYLFTTLEMTRAKRGSENDPLEPSGYVSAWYLTRVTSADGQHWMSFGYTPYTYQDGGGIVAQKYKITFFETLANFACTSQGDFASPVMNTQPNGNIIAGQSLSFITTSEGQKIDLVQYPTARKDAVTTENALSQIVVRGQTGNPDTVIKRTAFYYGYFGDSTSSVFARLKLGAVYELSGGGDTLNNYTFEYQHEFDPFPPKSTLGVDQWGYFNGGGDDPSTNSLLPRVTITTAFDGVQQTTFAPYANINPRTQYCQYGVISKVHLPTGGFTKYDFEQNKYTPLFAQQPVVAQTQVVTNTVFNNLDWHNATSLSGVHSFTIPNDVFGQRMLHIYYERTLYSQYSDPKKDFVSPLVIQQLVPGSCDDSGDGPSAGSTEGNMCRYDTLYLGPQLYTTDSRQDSIMLQPGTYLYYQAGTTADSIIETAMTFQYAVQQTNNNGPDGPGLRIAAIHNYTDASGNVEALQKTYTYTDSLGYASGVLQEDAKYQVWRTAEERFTSACTANPPVLVYNLSSDNNGIYNANLNFKFFYRAVRETTAPSVTGSYYTDHYFDPILSVLPPTVGTVYDAGLLQNFYTNENLLLTDPIEISTIHWKNTGTTFSKVSTERTDFNVTLDTSFVGIKPILLSDADGNTSSQLCSWGYNQYNIFSAWRYPTRKVATLYDSTGNSSTTTTRYLYNTVRRELVGTVESINNGDSIAMKMKYPADYIQFNDTIAALDRANMTNTVLETQVWRKHAAGDSVMIKGVANAVDPYLFKPLIKYFLFSSAPVASLDNETQDGDGTPRMPLYNSLITDSHYKEKIRYRYDGRGNIIETTLDSNTNVPTAYVWGYHSLYPVAKVVGARFNTVLSYIDTASIQAITSDAQLRLALGPLRSIPGAQVTLYTYTPFVGVTSQTDLNGRTSYYDYDKFNRVISIRDFNQNVVKSYAYQYAPLNVPVTASPSQSMPTITCLNQAGVTGFTATYTNTLTSQSYSFSISAAGGTLGSVPAGTYTISISKSGNTTPYDFSINCNSIGTTDTSATFYNVTISQSICNGITIDYNY